MKQIINILSKYLLKKFQILIIFSLLISNFSFSQVFSDDFNGIDSIWINYGDDGRIKDFYNEGDTVLYIGGSIKYVNDNLVSTIFRWNKNTITAYNNNNLTRGAFRKNKKEVVHF